MKLLKSLGLVALGIAATKLFPDQVDQIINWAKEIDAESIKAGIASIKEFFVGVVDIINGTAEMPAATEAATEAASGTATATQS